MLRKYAAFVSLFRSSTDMCIIGCIWLFVFFIRFHSGLLETDKGIPDFERHLILTIPVVLICLCGCVFTGLYRPKRVRSMLLQLADILKASVFSGLLVLAFLYYIQDVPYSRKLLALFVVTLFIGLVFSNLFTMVILRRLRAKGYNLRYCAVVGADAKGQQLVADIDQNRWLGLRCVFIVDADPNRIGTKLHGIPIFGPVEKLPELVKANTIDEVYLSLSGNEAQAAYPILETLQSTGVTIRIVPDWGNLASTSCATAITIGSQVLFSAADSPLNGVNIVLKEIFDRTMALILLILFAAPMAVIAVLVKLTSNGPVLHRQVRVGMDQKKFEMLKFRTMTVNAEEDDSPQWTWNNDRRRTRIGVWLRRMSLDELPQFINVVRGQMSLVGPRPERPCFAEQFSNEYKKYILRHKVKAGMTGWAQINGLRGDTSLRKRLLYDLYYIRNWSLELDLWILLRTPWHIIKGENAY